MASTHPQGNFFNRLFGHENAELRAPVKEDGWDKAAPLLTAAAVAQQAAAAQAPSVQNVNIVNNRPSDPGLRQVATINLANAAPAGGLEIDIRGNCLLYADSTNGTDRLSIVYADTKGDINQPARSMVPGRLRRERYFNFLYISWTVTAGATATLEIYDDPDGALYIQD